MHICFDNSSRLQRRIYYFEYRGVRFKLIQNKLGKWSDVLLTITPLNDRSAQEDSYSAAGEFLSAFSWHNSSNVSLSSCGGIGRPKSFKLRQATCHIFTYPKTSFSRYSFGYQISPIPEVENEDQRLALALFREARSSNKLFLSFLFYWQVMEVGGGEPIGWINKVYYASPRKIHIDRDTIKQLPLAGQKLGNYLYDHWRNAIAHIRRRRGRKTFVFDVEEENRRLAIATIIVERFSEYYIREALKLQKRLHIVRKGGGRFPVFVKEVSLRAGYWVPAYPEIVRR